MDDLKAMRLEVIRHGQELYAWKWRLRLVIENARSLEELEDARIVLA